MKPKPEHAKRQGSKRTAWRQRAQRRKRLQTMGVAILGMAGLAGLAVWGLGRPEPPAAGETIDPGRSRGNEAAPVMVEEYGDFQ